jgi:EAL and modified HD-GYP domain-containing signal transduction protein
MLLNFINSAYFSLKVTITSIRHVILLLGKDKLKSGLAMLLFISKDDQDIEANPIYMMVEMRSQIMENILEAAGTKNKVTLDTVNFVALLSLLEVVFKRPIDMIMKQMNVNETIYHAVVDKEGMYGKMLKLAIEIENNNWDGIDELLSELGITTEDLANANLKQIDLKK